MSALTAIILTGLGTYTMRALFILILTETKFPDWWIRTLGYVAPSVMAALVVSMLSDVSGRLVAGIPELSGLTMALIALVIKRNLLLALVLAMVVFWLAREII